MSGRPEILWDVDGVLIPPWQFRDLLDVRYAISPATTSPFFRGPFLACLVGSADLREELLPYLGQWGWKGTLDHFLEEWFESERNPVAEVVEFVAELRGSGYRCHVASNQERHRARYLADVVGLKRIFDELFFSSQFGARKPDPDFYLSVQEELGRPARELVFVDDSPENV